VASFFQAFQTLASTSRLCDAFCKGVHVTWLDCVWCVTLTYARMLHFFSIFLGKPYTLMRHHTTIVHLYWNKGLWIDDRVFKGSLSNTGNTRNLNGINANVTELRKKRCWPISMIFLSDRFGDIKKLRKDLNNYSWCPCRHVKHSHPQLFVSFAFHGTTLVEFCVGQNFPTFSSVQFNWIQVFHLTPRKK